MLDINKTTDPATASPARPYRSHKIPACDFCRKRRSRCTQEAVDQPCLLCRMHGAKCSRANISGAETSPDPRRPTEIRKRRRLSINRPGGDGQNPTASPITRRVPSNSPAHELRHEEAPPRRAATPTFAPNDISNDSGHIVGPAMARDAQVLERCMSSVYGTGVPYARPNPYSVYSDDNRNPIVYMKAPRHRNIVPSGNGTAGYRQFEAMEKIVEPLGPELCRIYFDHIHPPFPILDEKTVLQAYRQDGLPHTLTCEIYAVSLILWKASRKISATARPPPDIRYMWNLAVSAMNDDFLAPNMSTVLACILDLLGRPITSITYNAVNIGRVVALCQSLGLNRNPFSWGLEQRQKSLRIRTWWGVLIHDHWASLSHGTPPHVHNSQWDVPLPDSESLLLSSDADQDSGNDIRMRGGRSFMALCSLTAILGDILPLIYALRTRPLDESFSKLRQYETSLNEWEEGLPLWLRPASPAFERTAPGALNLQLSFLAVKLCLSRIALLEIHRADDRATGEDKLYYQSRCRKAARTIIDFVVTLAPSEVDVFWLPYTAYHFTSAATLILRCALEAETAETARECVGYAKRLTDFLRRMKNDINWDLADICLGQCEAVVDRLCDGNYLDTWRKNPHHSQSTAERLQRGAPSVHVNIPHSGVPAHRDFQPQDQALHAGSAIDGARDVTDPGYMNSDLFQDSMMLGAVPGIMMESPLFPDFWQMPYVDDYSQRGFD